MGGPRFRGNTEPDLVPARVTRPASAGHGSGIISPGNDDQAAERLWRLSRLAGPDSRSYLNWNAVPWYVLATARAANATSAGGHAALPYLHDFVLHPGYLRVVVVMGGFAERCRLRYLRRAESPVLPLITAPHPSARARIGHPGFEQEILVAMTRARRAAADEQAAADNRAGMFRCP